MSHPHERLDRHVIGQGLGAVAPKTQRLFDREARSCGPVIELPEPRASRGGQVRLARPRVEAGPNFSVAGSSDTAPLCVGHCRIQASISARQRRHAPGSSPGLSGRARNGLARNSPRTLGATHGLSFSLGATHSTNGVRLAEERGRRRMNTELSMQGPMSGRNIIGEVTEAVHKFLLDGYDLSERPPRFEEDLSFVPKDKEQVIYLYMYRLCQNPNLINQKRLRQAPVFIKGNGAEGETFYHRPP